MRYPQVNPRTRSVNAAARPFRWLHLIAGSLLLAGTPSVWGFQQDAFRYDAQLPTQAQYRAAAELQNRALTSYKRQLDAAQAGKTIDGSVMDEARAQIKDSVALFQFLNERLQERTSQQTLRLEEQQQWLAELVWLAEAPIADIAKRNDDDLKRINELLVSHLQRIEPPNSPVPFWGEPATEESAAWSVASSEKSADREKDADYPTPYLDLLPEAAVASVPALLNYFQQSVSYTPYFGNMRSADSVLRHRAGNDLDIAQAFLRVLWDMGQEGRIVNGRVKVPLANIKQLLHVGDVAAVSGVLNAAEIPFELITTGGSVTHVRLERFWVESYLPVSNYRGVEAGDGAREWIALDPAFGVFDADLTDPLAGSGLDAIQMLDDFHRQPNRDALAWLNGFMVTQFGSNLHDLGNRFHADREAANLLPMSLPYQVEETLNLFVSTPRNLQHQVTFKVYEGADLVMDETLAVSRLLGQPVVWDAVPYDAADWELVSIYGSRWQVPGQLITLRPAIMLAGAPVAVADEGLRPGAQVRVQLTLTTPGGSARTTENHMTVGGFAALGLGAPGNFFEATQSELPASYAPFGNFLAALLDRYHAACTAADQQVGKALGIRSIYPAPQLTWLGIQHVSTLVGGVDLMLQPSQLWVDAELRPQHAVPEHTGIPASRAANHLMLSGLVAAGLEGQTLREAAPNFQAASVSDILALAYDLGTPPETFVPAQGAEIDLLALPAGFKQQLVDFLWAGAEVQTVVGPVDRNGFSFVAAVAYQPATGETAWLLDSSLSGAASFTYESDWPGDMQDAADEPSVDTREYAADRVVFLFREEGSGLQAVNADEPEVTIRYRALNAFGRPVEGAHVKLTPLTYQNARNLVLPTEYWAESDDEGVAEFTFNVPAFTFLNPHYFRIEETHSVDDVVALLSFQAEVERQALGNLLSNVRVEPGAPNHWFHTIDRNWPRPGVPWRIYPDDGVNVYVFIRDQFRNGIANEWIHFASNPDWNFFGLCDLEQFEVIPSGFNPPRPLTSVFYRTFDEFQQQMTEYSLVSEARGAAVIVSRGSAGYISALDQHGLANIYSYVDEVHIDTDAGLPQLAQFFAYTNRFGSEQGGLWVPNPNSSCNVPVLDTLGWPIDHWEAYCDAGSMNAAQPAVSTCFYVREIGIPKIGNFELPTSGSTYNWPKRTLLVPTDGPRIANFQYELTQRAMMEVPVDNAFCAITADCPISEELPFDVFTHLLINILEPDCAPSETVIKHDHRTFDYNVNIPCPGFYYSKIHARRYFAPEYYRDSAFRNSFFLGYSVQLEEDDLPVLKVDEQLRLVADTLLKPVVLPTDFNGKGPHYWEIIQDGVPVFQDHTASTGIYMLKGSIFSPGAEYFVRFVFNVDETINPGESFDSGLLPLRVEFERDLDIYTIDNGALWLDQAAPETTKDGNCDDQPGNGEPGVGYTVASQYMINNHVRDYDRVELHGWYLNTWDPNREPDVSITLPGAATQVGQYEQSPIPTGTAVNVGGLNINGQYMWQLVGYDNNGNPEFEGDFRPLPVQFLVRGVGVADGPAFGQDTTYNPEYEFEIVSDPTGSMPQNCGAFSSFLGFGLSAPATVTFQLAGSYLAENQRFEPGDHRFPEFEFDTLGRHQWQFTARFEDQDGESVVIEREGYVEVLETSRSGLRVGDTRVKGVSLTNGSLGLSSTDIAISGRGAGLTLSRTYSSQVGKNYNSLGIGWTHNYLSRLVDMGCSHVSIVGGDGAGLTFQLQGDAFVPFGPGIHSSLTRDPITDLYTLRLKSGMKYVYTAPIPKMGDPNHPFRYVHNLQYIEDPFGNRVTLQYNEINAVLDRVTDDAGRALVFQYQLKKSLGYWLLTGVTTENVDPPIEVIYQHDKHGRLIQATRDMRTDSYVYSDPCIGVNERNNLIETTNGNGRVTRYLYYDETTLPGNLRAAEFVRAIIEDPADQGGNPANIETFFDYGVDQGAATAVVWDAIASTSYTFNFHGQPEIISGPLGTKTMQWAPNDVLLLSETDESGRLYTYTYDANGNMTSKTQSGGHYAESWVYDPYWNKPVLHTDPRGNTTTWELNDQGSVEKMTNAERQVTEYRYAENGDLTKVIDPNDNEVDYSFDLYGYPATQTLPDGNTITTVYDSRGRMLSQSDSSGRSTVNSYDRLNRLITSYTSAAQSDGRLQQFEYLPLGQVTLQIDGKLRTEMDYDAMDRVIQVRVDPGEGQTQRVVDTSYDIHGNKLTEIVHAGAGSRSYVYQYDAADRLIATTLNGQPYSAFTYEPGTELMASETDWRGATTRYGYDVRLHLDYMEVPTGHSDPPFYTRDFTYDAAGNKTLETDANGVPMITSYDQVNRVESVQNGLGQVTQNSYDDNGNLVRQENLTTGRGFTRVYDAMNRPIQENRFNGDEDQITTFSYENFGRRVAVAPPLDAAITSDYNELGQLISREQAGITVGYTYDGGGNVKRIDHPESYVTQQLFDGLGRKVSEVDPHGDTQTWTYDALGNLVQQIDPRGVQTSFTYDRFDRVLTRAMVYQRGSVIDTASESFSYQQNAGLVTETATDIFGNTVTTVSDAMGRALSVTDALRGTATQLWDGENLLESTDFRGFTTVFEQYDALNRLLQQTDDGGTVFVSFDDANHRVTAKDRREITTIDQYDVMGNLISRTRAGIVLEQNTYDAQNRLIESLDGSLRPSRVVFDALGRLTSRSVGEGNEAQTTSYLDYDDLGRPATIHDGLHQRALTYDYYGRTLTVTNELGETVSHLYDPIGNLISRTSPSPNGGTVTTTFTYDLLNNIVQVDEPMGAVTSYAWSPNWSQCLVTDAENESSNWTYDAAHRLVSLQRPGLGVTSYTYDNHDNMETVTRPIGSVTFQYDYLNRLGNETWIDPNGVATIGSISRSRDANGNLTQVTQTGSEGSYTRTINYDELDRPDQFSDSRGFALAIDYEDNGNRQQVTYPNTAFQVSYQYDSANRLAAATIGALGDVTYGWLPNGLIQSMDMPNGASSSWTYDAANRPDILTLARPGGSTSYNLDYYPDGSRSRLIEDHGALGVRTTTYQYDDRSRLQDWTRVEPDRVLTTQYTLDAVGNRTLETEFDDKGYVRNRAFMLLPGHRIGGFDEVITQDAVTVGDRSVTYAYDLNGNRTEKNEIDNQAKRVDSTYFHWDAKNRLRRVDVGGVPTQHFDYDDLDRRIRKAGDTRFADPVLYVWDELAVLAEYGEDPLGISHTELANYAFGVMRLAMTRPGFEAHWLQSDPMGSTANITQHSDGGLVEATTYDPYGQQEVLFTSGDGGWNRIGFTGHEYDPETDLTYAKARYYDQDLGIFLGQDPVLGSFDTPPSLHRYLYANSNPMMFTDPTGRQAQDTEERTVDDEVAEDLPGRNANLVVSKTVNEASTKATAVTHKAVEVAGYIFVPIDEVETISDPDTSGWEKIGAGLFLTPMGKVVRVSGRFFGFVKRFEVVGKYFKRRKTASVVEEGIDANKTRKRLNAGSAARTPQQAGRKLVAAASSAKRGEDEAQSLAVAVGQSDRIHDAGTIKRKTKARKQKGQDFADAEHQQELEDAFTNLGKDDPRKNGVTSDSKSKRLIGTQNPSTRNATKTGRAYDRRFTRFWRRLEGKNVGEWKVVSVNRRLGKGIQPDLVLVDHESKRLRVVDLTSEFNSSHVKKGQKYVEFLKREYPEYTPEYRETYWRDFADDVEALDRSGSLYFPFLED